MARIIPPSDKSVDQAIIENFGQTFLGRGTIQSPNYVPEKRGWSVDDQGHAEFRSVNIGSEIINLSAGQSVEQAILELNAGEGGIINLGIGTFTMPARTISFTKPILLNGISPAQTIIDFNNTAGKFSFQGTGVYSTGTITSITSGTAVVGSGTSWLANVTPYTSMFFINGWWHLVGAVADDTHLTLLEGYVGPAISAGTAYVVATPVTDIRIENLAIKNSTGSALDFDYVRFITLTNLLLQDNNIGVDANYFSEFARERLIAISQTSDGYKYTNGGRSSSLYENSVSSGGHGLNLDAVRTFSVSFSAHDASTADGIHFKGSNDLGLFSVQTNFNGGQGIEGESTSDNVTINDPIVKSNTSDGIKFTATIDNSRIVGGNISSNGGYAINIAASTCDNNTILAPYLASNTSGDVNDSGTGTIRIQQGDFLKPFGGGSDGSATISSNTTLASDKFYQDLTVDSGFALSTAGYVIYVAGTLTVNGTIKNNGAAGSDGQNGDTGSNGGAGGAGGAGATLAAGKDGKTGGAGGNPGTAGTAGAAANPSLGSAGVAGGAGGADGAGPAGGAAGAAGAATGENGSVDNGFSPSPLSSASVNSLNSYIFAKGATSGASLSPSAGSGSGGGGGGGGAGGGGGSGGTGGIVAIYAKTIVVGASGAIQANGGDGGKGGNGQSATNNGGAGGGGGGSGGVIILAYKSLTNNGSIAAAGGAAGAKGTKVGTGTDGNAGTAGNSGKIYQIQLL